MPTIKKPKKKKNYQKHNKNKDIAKIYNSQKWVKLRNAYLAEHPLCQRCLEEGRITPTAEIHHKIPISTGYDELSMATLAYDWNNLEALCVECHHKIHQMLKNNKKINLN